jgi:hypothetical protein
MAVCLGCRVYVLCTVRYVPKPCTVHYTLNS